MQGLLICTTIFWWRQKAWLLWYIFGVQCNFGEWISGWLEAAKTEICISFGLETSLIAGSWKVLNAGSGSKRGRKAERRGNTAVIHHILRGKNMHLLMHDFCQVEDLQAGFLPRPSWQQGPMSPFHDALNFLELRNQHGVGCNFCTGVDGNAIEAWSHKLPPLPRR